MARLAHGVRGNAPLALALVLAADRFLPRLAHTREQARFDWLGALLSTVVVAVLALAVIEGQGRGWSSAFVLTAFTVGVVALAGFVAWERRVTGPLIISGVATLGLLRLAPDTGIGAIWWNFAEKVSVLARLAFGASSEKAAKRAAGGDGPGGSPGEDSAGDDTTGGQPKRGRGQQRGSAGHGRARPPGLLPPANPRGDPRRCRERAGVPAAALATRRSGRSVASRSTGRSS